MRKSYNTFSVFSDRKVGAQKQHFSVLLNQDCSLMTLIMDQCDLVVLNMVYCMKHVYVKTRASDGFFEE